MRKKLSVFILFTMCLSLLLCGCTSEEDKAKVYYLNFKPEVAGIWEEIAEKYTEETGVEMKVLTAESGIYEQTLKAEAGKKDCPTLFQINGPIGYQEWKKFCVDLKDTGLYDMLLDKNLAVESEGGIYGIPYVVEGYGIIYNDDIMKKYFALPNKSVSISDAREINNFETLKAVVEDMTKHKSELGIDGVFASTSLGSGEDWRWTTHLANLPIYYEYTDKGISNSDTIDFSYQQNFKNIFDLYINNSCSGVNELAKKTVANSMEEFATGKVAMVQNGNWAWSQISGVEGNIVKEDDVKFLPIYTGVSGEENQGLCIGTENYFCVNSKVSEKNQKATIDFIKWLFTSDTGKDYVTNKLGFIAPFNTFSDEEKPKDPLAREVLSYMANDKLTTVQWNFTAFPSVGFKDNLGSNLLKYANNEVNWKHLLEDAKADWASNKGGAKE